MKVMKVKIKNYLGDFPQYLTIGKEYDFEVWGEWGNDESLAGGIQDDEGLGLLISIKNCDFLNGGDWELVNGV